MISAEPLHYLNKLHRILNWSDSRIEFAYGLPILYQLAVGLMLWITVLLTPYVLYLLLRLRKWSWLAGFGILIIFGLLFGTIGSAVGLQAYLSAISITFFMVAYMWMLRQRVNEWQGLARFEQEMRRERLQKQRQTSP
jgi:Na+/citrate or Na+/malate symporter